ncbi:AAA family ATPase, partial [Gilvimarinus sp. 1_MG-2023]|nr:AAA family ATPase [Gilvimarinus sp. 1_MG-2023]
IYVEALVERFPTLSYLADQLRFGHRAEVPFVQLTVEQLDFLETLYLEAGPSMAGQAAQLATLKQAMGTAGERFEAGNLELLVAAITEYLLQDAIRGWLFRVVTSGKPIA